MCVCVCVCVQDSVLIVLICIIKRIKDLIIFKDLLGAGNQISAVFFSFSADFVVFRSEVN